MLRPERKHFILTVANKAALVLLAAWIFDLIYGDLASAPQLVYLIIFGIGLYAPMLVSPLLLCVLGVIKAVWMGLNSAELVILYLLCYLGTLAVRHLAANLSFWRVWGVCTLMMMALFCLQGLFHAFVGHAHAPYLYVALKVGATIAAYPLVSQGIFTLLFAPGTKARDMS